MNGSLFTTLAVGSLAFIAFFHLLWAVGIYWPGKDMDSLMAYTGGHFRRNPNALEMLVVALVFLTGAALLATHRGWLPELLSPSLVSVGCWLMVLAFLARGIGGYWEHLIRSQILEMPYGRLTRVFYSPLAIATAISAALGLVLD